MSSRKEDDSMSSAACVDAAVSVETHRRHCTAQARWTALCGIVSRFQTAAVASCKAIARCNRDEEMDDARRP